MTLRECDVLVVGGGPAGIAASTAAGRHEADVVLIEKYGFLGGLAVAGASGCICGLYLGSRDEVAAYAPGLFPAEWGGRLAKACNTQPVSLGNGLHVLPYDTWRFQLLAEAVVCETERVEPVFHSVVTSVVADGVRVVEVEAFAWNRLVRFRPRVVVDCTGEASVVALAGADCSDESDSQTAGSIISLAGVTIDLSERATRLSVLRQIAQATAEERLSEECGNLSFLSFVPSDGLVHFKLGLPERFLADWNRLTRIEIYRRRVADELSQFLAREVHGFDNARVLSTSLQAGIRVGRRIIGRFTLKAADVLSCRKFHDGIACGSWPMELWRTAVRPEMTMLPEDDWYDIPIGCLQPQMLDNVLTAGRCISADAQALSSARVIGVCFATGWAAGTVAAFQAMGREQSAAVVLLRNERELMGSLPVGKEIIP